jgi:hypothetical protein
VITLLNSELTERLKNREVTVTLKNILDNARADSGGERDVNFLKYLLDHHLLTLSEYLLKRTIMHFVEEYFMERYSKFQYESDRHYICRTLIQEELGKMDMGTMAGTDAGNMTILRANSSYDIILEDFSTLIDIGLTPARNFFRGITDLRVKNYLISSYYDDYMDDIVFSGFSRVNDNDFLDAVRDYEEGYKMYTPNPQPEFEERKFYDSPNL